MKPPTEDEVRAWGVHCTVTQAAAVFGISRGTAYALLREGRFPVPTLTSPTGRTLVPTHLLVDWLHGRDPADDVDLELRELVEREAGS